MAIQTSVIQAINTTGKTLYAVIHAVISGTPSVWNKDLNTWEAFNSSHWANYAVPLTEQAGTGYYIATYPAGISGVLTTEVIYVQAGGSPTVGDGLNGGIGSSQGINVDGIAGDQVAAANLQAGLSSEVKGAATGTPTTTSIPTNLTSTQTNAYQGRSLVITSGVAAQCVGRIIAYAPTNGVLTLAAPLPIAPVAADTFVIV